MWKKYGITKQATDDNLIRHMCIASWVPTNTDTHSKYVIIFYFPRRQ